MSLNLRRLRKELPSGWDARGAGKRIIVTAGDPGAPGGRVDFNVDRQAAGQIHGGERGLAQFLKSRVPVAVSDHHQ